MLFSVKFHVAKREVRMLVPVAFEHVECLLCGKTNFRRRREKSLSVFFCSCGRAEGFLCTTENIVVQ